MATTEDLRDAWRSLSSHGTPPEPELASRVLPSWSVCIDDWIDRLTETYLRDYSRRYSHYKLVIAQYGGGKSHFLLAARKRALDEGFAACYLRCTQNTSLSDWASFYLQIADSMRLPGREAGGVRHIIEAALESVRKRAQAAPEPEAAIAAIINNLEFNADYPSASFQRVAAIAIREMYGQADVQLLSAAIRWLGKGQSGLTRQEMTRLGLSHVPSGQTGRHGLEMFHSLVRFLTDFTGVHGLVLLLDETDMMFTSRGQALANLMGALRTLIDQSDDALGPIPVLGLLAAVPDINERMEQYPALSQRFRVTIPFDTGDDQAPQIDLAKVGGQREFLLQLGEKLQVLRQDAFEMAFDPETQRANLTGMVEAAMTRMADVDSRRLFVKSWCSLLDEQARSGERQFPQAQLDQALQGSYDWLRTQTAAAPDDVA